MEIHELSRDSRLRDVDPDIFQTIVEETNRQHNNIELIASENFASAAVLEALGSCLTNKYAEGYPGARWYGGCEVVDRVESLAIERAKLLFGAEHANVQPHSGTQANIAVFNSVLKPGDTILAMNLAHGGHLSHGHPKNFSGKFFKIVPYGVNPKTEQIDYDEIAQLARDHKPNLILAGFSAYSRFLDFKRFREIADSVGAILMADIAHVAGLVVAGLYPSPVPYAEFVTTTTHKTLRGPRGGMILCKKDFAKKIDSEVFPGTQGGPLMHVIAAKAVCFKEALEPSFKDYQGQVVKNAKALSASMVSHGFRIVSGGTDNHLMLVDLAVKQTTGKDAQTWLDGARITVNKNMIPFDSQPAVKSSGIRLGTPAVTTRGMKEAEMAQIASLIDEVLVQKGAPSAVEGVRERVARLVEKFPLYRELLS